MNINSQDVEDDCNKFLLVPKKIWKCFDYTCYSVFTDDLEKVDNVVKVPNTLKALQIPSFKTFNTIDNFVKKE